MVYKRKNSRLDKQKRNNPKITTPKVTISGVDAPKETNIQETNIQETITQNPAPLSEQDSELEDSSPSTSSRTPSHQKKKNKNQDADTKDSIGRSSIQKWRRDSDDTNAKKLCKRHTHQSSSQFTPSQKPKLSKESTTPEIPPHPQLNSQPQAQEISFNQSPPMLSYISPQNTPTIYLPPSLSSFECSSDQDQKEEKESDLSKGQLGPFCFIM